MLKFNNPHYYTGLYGDAIAHHQMPNNVSLKVTVRMSAPPKNDKSTWLTKREEMNSERLIKADNDFSKHFNELTNFTSSQPYKLNPVTMVERM
jgi:hypothetical protein